MVRLLFGLSPAIRSCLAEGIYGSLHCSKVSAFSQIMEALKKLLSTSMESQMPLPRGVLSGSPHWQPGELSLLCPSVVLCSRVSSQHLFLGSRPAACYFFPSLLLLEIVDNAGEFSAMY